MCILLLFSTSAGTRLIASKNRTVRILSLLPNQTDTKLKSDGQIIALALEMAAERINSQTEILPDYLIELVHADSGSCNDTRYIQMYNSIINKLFYSQYNVAGIIGPICSSSSVALSFLLSKGISLVSLHGGNDPVLSDRSRHPFALGSLGSSEGFSQFAVKLIHKSNWTRIAVLFDEFDRSNTATISKLYNEIIVPSEEGYVSSISKTYLPLADIVDKDLRVIFLFLPVALTQRVLCLAQHRGMMYNYYQWIILGNTFDEVAQDVNFTYEGQNYVCSKKEMKSSALNGTYFIEFQISARNESASTVSGYSFKEYDQVLQRRIEEYNSQSSYINISYSPQTPYFYDSLWSWSVALDSLTKKHPNLNLSSYNYSNYTVSNMLLDEFYSLNFDGVSGRFSFNGSTGYVERALSLFQVVEERLILVADFADGVFEKIGPFISISDRSETQITTVNNHLVPPFFLIGTMELIIVITLHLITVKYRSRQSVKATSFWLNQFIYLGCYFLLSTALIFTLQEHSKINGDPSILIDVIQNLSTLWLNPIWFTFVMGSVGARTWQLYRIFIHYLNPGPLISNKFLVLLVLGLVSIDVVFSTLGTAFDRFQPQDIFIEGTIRPRIFVRRWMTNSRLWLGLFYTYKLILYLIVVFLAFATRGIQNQSFSTKTLRVVAYLGGIFVFEGFGITILFEIRLFTAPEDIRAQILFCSNVGGLYLLLFLIILFLHLPPLMPIFRESFKHFARQILVKLRANKKLDQV